MAGSLNKVILIGRMGSDPDYKETSSSTVCNVSIATSEIYKDKQGNKKEDTEWHKLVFWGKLADLVNNFTKQGSLIYVEGKKKTRNWEDKDGNKRQNVDIECNEFKMLDNKGDSEGAKQQFNNTIKKEVEDLDSDLPF